MKITDSRFRFHSVGGHEVEFQSSDYDETLDVTYNYYGFLDPNGAWIIMRVTKDSTSYRYSAGRSGYTDNWTSRGTLTYKYYNQLFED